MQRDGVTSRDRGELGLGLAIAMPIIMILCLVLIVVLWVKTGLIAALIVFAGLCCIGAIVVPKWQKRSRGL